MKQNDNMGTWIKDPHSKIILNLDSMHVHIGCYIWLQQKPYPFWVGNEVQNASINTKHAIHNVVLDVP